MAKKVNKPKAKGKPKEKSKPRRVAQMGVIKREAYTPIGRPSLYSEDVANRICELIAASSDSLVKILIDNPDLPAYYTIMHWLNNKDAKFDSFRHNYARAREDKADYMADEVIRVVNEATEDMITRKITSSKASPYAQMIKTKVDAYKWAAGKMKPKVYSDKAELVQQTNNQINMNVNWLPYPLPTPEQLKQIENTDNDTTKP